MGGYRLGDIWGAFRRRFWLLIVSVILIGPLAIGIAAVLPARYQSTALILVESQQISSQLITSTVTVSAAEQLQLIQQRLMTRENLLDLIAKYDLYAERTDLSPTEKVEMVRRNTFFDVIAQPNAARNSGALSAFNITFVGNGAGVVAAVANEFVTKILEENAKARTDRATETLSFFTQQVKDLSEKLSAIEAEITRFKNENERALPESLAFRRQELSNVQARVFQREQARLAMLEQKRALEEALRTGQIGSLAGRVLSREEQDLLTLRNLLVQRQAVLAETHPEILSLKARIVALEKVLAPGNDPAAAQASIAVAQARQQIQLLEKQIALLDEQQRADEALRAEIETSIAATPQVEMTLNGLIRRQGQLQNEYTIAVANQTAASSGERLEVNKQAERFELIEPAQVPDRPFSPNRPLIAAAGVVASFAVGFGLMVLAELMNSSIRTAHMLEFRTGLRPVVTIPYVMTAGERRGRVLRWAFFVLVFLVAVPGALWLVDRLYLPLDVLFERLADRTGLSGLIRLIEIRMGG